jgi:putative transposase
MPIIPKDQLKALIKEYKLKDAKDIQEMLKSLFGDTLKEMLEAEFDHELGYSKYDYKSFAKLVFFIVCVAHVHVLLYYSIIY